MKRNEFFLKSADNETNIHIVIWEPEGKMYGILHINHGINDSILNYDEMANFLCKGNLVVVGLDVVGHGYSTNNGTKENYFGGPGSYKYLIEDINSCVSYVKQLYPDLPYIMLGYSLGSYLTRAYMFNYGNVLSGMILVSTTYKGKFKLNRIKKAIDKEIKKLGDKSNSSKIDKMIYGVDTNISLGMYRDMVDCMFYINSTGLDLMNKSKPVYVMYSNTDMVCDKGKEVLQLEKDLRKNKYTDIVVKGYDNVSRDILHVDNKYDIYNDIYGWIMTKVLRSVPTSKDQVLTNGVTALNDERIKAAHEHFKKQKQSNVDGTNSMINSTNNTINIANTVNTQDNTNSMMVDNNKTVNVVGNVVNNVDSGTANNVANSIVNSSTVNNTNTANNVVKVVNGTGNSTSNVVGVAKTNSVASTTTPKVVSTTNVSNASIVPKVTNSTNVTITQNVTKPANVSNSTNMSNPANVVSSSPVTNVQNVNSVAIASNVNKAVNPNNTVTVNTSNSANVVPKPVNSANGTVSNGSTVNKTVANTVSTTGNANVSNTSKVVGTVNIPNVTKVSPAPVTTTSNVVAANVNSTNNNVNTVNNNVNSNE